MKAVMGNISAIASYRESPTLLSPSRQVMGKLFNRADFFIIIHFFSGSQKLSLATILKAEIRPSVSKSKAQINK